MSQDERRQWVLAALDQYEVRLLRYAQRLVGDFDLARDAVQHAFVKLCESDVVGTLRVPSGSNGTTDGKNGTRSVPTTMEQLAPWLFRVCRNRALDHLRGVGREQPSDGLSVEQLAGRELDPAAASEARELAECLRELIEQLPAAQREALDLWCEGFAYREIGEIIGRPEGHVRVLVHRGLTKLREHPQVQGWLESRPPTPSGTGEKTKSASPLALSKK